MMDQDEEVALEFSTWIGGNSGIFSLSVVISLSVEGGGRWLAVLMFFVELHHWKECWSQFCLGLFGVMGFGQTCFPIMTPSPPCAG